MVERSQRFVVIGSGVAGLSAAQSMRSIDARSEIVMISDEPHGYYSRPGLAYYITGEVEERYLFPFEEDELQKMGMRRIHARVEAVDPAAHQVHLGSGGILLYDRLLIAVGAQAILPDIPGMQYQGVVKLDHLEDARSLLKLARNARRAVVVGGGITALEIVEGLIARKVEVHYLLR
jgi:NADPH-dependent 2,4-dienoyl-CoA reductase/sulfur reductase-like enzyme